MKIYMKAVGMARSETKGEQLYYENVKNVFQDAPGGSFRGGYSQS